MTADQHLWGSSESHRGKGGRTKVEIKTVRLQFPSRGTKLFLAGDDDDDDYSVFRRLLECLLNCSFFPNYVPETGKSFS